MSYILHVVQFILLKGFTNLISYTSGIYIYNTSQMILTITSSAYQSSNTLPTFASYFSSNLVCPTEIFLPYYPHITNSVKLLSLMGYG